MTRPNSMYPLLVCRQVCPSLWSRGLHGNRIQRGRGVCPSPSSPQCGHVTGRIRSRLLNGAGHVPVAVFGRKCNKHILEFPPPRGPEAISGTCELGGVGLAVC